MMRFGIMSGGPCPYPVAVARNTRPRIASARSPMPEAQLSLEPATFRTGDLGPPLEPVGAPPRGQIACLPWWTLKKATATIGVARQWRAASRPTRVAQPVTRLPKPSPTAQAAELRAIALY
jgi:hypothetical protein